MEQQTNMVSAEAKPPSSDKQLAPLVLLSARLAALASSHHVENCVEAILWILGFEL